MVYFDASDVALLNVITGIYIASRRVDSSTRDAERYIKYRCCIVVLLFYVLTYESGALPIALRGPAFH